MTTRRQILAAAGLQCLLPQWAIGALPVGSARQAFELTIRDTAIPIAGRQGRAQTINGSLPGPLLRMREGDRVSISVRNQLTTDTSLHWHGLLVPPGMDGVPGISFPGIPPGDSFTYQFRLRQAGTYWYHSHSEFQEPLGVYAPLIVDPLEPEPFAYDREFIIVLSDWSFEHPRRIYSKLKKHADYYNRNLPGLDQALRDERGIRAAIGEDVEWSRMRMMQTDIADVTGATFTYLLNGHSTMDPWLGVFVPGERIRLRFINAAAMTYFNVRLPGVPMTVVQSDGQNLQPFETDEFQLAVAETLDVLISPRAGTPHTLIAEAMDRSGLVFGSISSEPGEPPAAPALRAPPKRTMADMGHGDGHAHHDHRNHGHDQGSARPEQGHADSASKPVAEASWEPRRGPGVANVVSSPSSRLDEPGTGLENVAHRTLTYAQFAAHRGRSVTPIPQREFTLHLTGNMHRYMWSFDGERYSKRTEPIELIQGECVRFTLINHTMMEHPIHLHGMWMELENGKSPLARKHTISVKPAERLSVLVIPDEPGDWAFHCHLLLHMKAGMNRVVRVIPAADSGNRHA